MPQSYATAPTTTQVMKKKKKKKKKRIVDFMHHSMISFAFNRCSQSATLPSSLLHSDRDPLCGWAPFDMCPSHGHMSRFESSRRFTVFLATCHSGHRVPLRQLALTPALGSLALLRIRHLPFRCVTDNPFVFAATPSAELKMERRSGCCVSSRTEPRRASVARFP
jgi:hypothetical protein